MPRFSKKPGPHKLYVKPKTLQVRPFVVAAVLRNITFNEDRYNSFIDLQEKLHQNLCRKRALVAIGTHDLDTIEGPFTYDAKPPNYIKFIPLKQTQEYTASELMDLYSTDNHLKHYLPIIRDKPVYPVIYDKNNVVLSLPPVINGKFILKFNFVNEYQHKAEIVLDTLVCMFSQYCEEPFVVETVEVIRADNSKYDYPKLNYRKDVLTVDYINNRLGISCSGEEITKLLLKMGLECSLNENSLEVTIPPTRHDILHACDIMEDVGISYGYNNIKWTLPNAPTIGDQFMLNKLTDQLRYEISRCGYTEALTFSLCSEEDIGKKMRNLNALDEAVKISNPKTIDFEVARTSLIPGLLKTIHSNKQMPLPLKIFEISDIVVKDNSKEVGARNERNLCALNYNKTPGFEIIHGLLDRLMQVLNISYSTSKNETGYFIKACQDERFLSGRCAHVVLNGSVIGVMGVLHPEVIGNFELNQPCAVLEISVEKLEYQF
ncbi:phenylalanine--tRNA ligase beta subunit-like protein, partial [Dinothrombium tinctorium]